MGRTLKGCGLIILGFLALTFIFGTLAGDDETTQETPTVTSSPPSQSGTFAEEAVPTEKPTQAPTAMPEPTPAPSGPPPEVQAYAQSIVPPIQGIGNGLQHIGELFSDPRMEDPEWQVDLVVAIAEIQTSHETLQGIDAPPEMEGVHTQVLAASQACNDATFRQPKL